jgi:NAD(P)-dependent dehydrogenase (short-subunit alcohol dehydrogenase family)
MGDYLHSLFSLNGKVALVTGASRGIGAAVVDALTGAGAYTVGIGRSDAPRCPFKDGAVYRQCDILDAELFKALCASIVESRNRLDILVNAAAITVPKRPNDDPNEVFDRTIALNLVAAHRCCQTAASHMKRVGGGSIVNFISLAAIFGFPENPGYGAAKGGLRVLSKALALDFAADGIRVNNIVPGYIRTDMTAASFNDPVRHAERLQRMMIKRWGVTEDFAGAAIFLASNASSYVTGIDLIIDGGWAAKGL